MPVIRQYQRQVRDQPVNRRQATPNQFGAQVGEALVQVGRSLSGAGQVVERVQTQKEVSALSVRLAEARSENALARQRFLREVDPGNDEAFQAFSEEASARIEQARGDISSFQARDMFDRTSAQMRGDLAVGLERSRVELLGEFAAQNYQKSLNSLSTAAMAEPSSLNSLLSEVETSIDSFAESGLLGQNQKAKALTEAKAEIVKSAVRGWAELSPAVAREKLESKAFDSLLGADQKRQLMAEVDRAERGLEIERDRIQKLREDALEQRNIEVQNDFLVKMSEGALSTKDILASSLPPVGSGSKQQFLNLLKQANEKGPPKTNPYVFQTLFDRINLDPGDPDRITSQSELNQYLGQGVSYTDLLRLRKEFSGLTTEQGKRLAAQKKQLFSVAKAALATKSMMGIPDPKGQEHLAMFQQLVFEAVDAKQKANEDVSVLFNPTSKEYLGNIIEQFKRSPQEIMRDQMRLMTGRSRADEPSDTAQTGEAQKRRPGESAMDYMKRLNLVPQEASAQ